MNRFVAFVGAPLLGARPAPAPGYGTNHCDWRSPAGCDADHWRAATIEVL